MTSTLEEYIKRYPHANEGQIMQMMDDDGKAAAIKSNALNNAQKEKEAQERNEAHRKLIYLKSGSPKGLLGNFDGKELVPITLLDEIHEYGMYTGFVYEDFYEDVIIFCGARAYIMMDDKLFRNRTMTNTLAPFTFEVRKI